MLGELNNHQPLRSLDDLGRLRIVLEDVGGDVHAQRDVGRKGCRGFDGRGDGRPLERCPHTQLRGLGETDFRADAIRKSGECFYCHDPAPVQPNDRLQQDCEHSPRDDPTESQDGRVGRLGVLDGGAQGGHDEIRGVDEIRKSVRQRSSCRYRSPAEDQTADRAGPAAQAERDERKIKRVARVLWA